MRNSAKSCEPPQYYLRFDQHVDLVINDGVESFILEILDRVLGVIVIAPTKNNQT